MILFQISKSSIDETVSYIDHVKERVLVGIRLGMKDGVRGLAEAETEAAVSAHPPRARNNEGDHLATILSRAGRVIETDSEITAVYRPKSRGKQPHYWLEYGAEVGPVDRALMAMQIGGDTVFRMARKGFSLAPKPFFYSTAEAYVNNWFDAISKRVDEAMHA